MKGGGVWWVEMTGRMTLSHEWGLMAMMGAGDHGDRGSVVTGQWEGGWDGWESGDGGRCGRTGRDEVKGAEAW